MKKLLALLLVCILILPGCHSAKPLERFDIPQEFDTSRDFQITFWAKNENNASQREIYRQAELGFEALYPNVDVVIRNFTNYNDIYNDVLTNIQTGTTPNVCITYPDHIATYLTGENTVVPLDALMEDSAYGFGGSQLRFDGPLREQIIPQFLSECVVNGNYYALPYMRSTEACYVNKTMLEQLGFTLPEVLTWDFIWQVAQKAMEKNPDGTFAVNGQSTLIPVIYKSTDNMMISLLEQLDAGYSTDSGQVELFNDTTRSLLLELGDYAKSRIFSTFSVSGYPANFLNAGQCIFAIDSTAGATWMGCQAPLIDISQDKLQEFETVVMPIPQADPQSPKMISQGPSLCIFNKEDPQEVLASWLFAQYLLTNQVQIAYSQTEGYLPVTSKAHESEEYLDYLSRAGEDNQLYYDIKIAASRLLLDNLENTFVTPVFNGSTNLRQCAGQLIEEVTKGARRGKNVNEAFLEQTFQELRSLYHLDEIQVTQVDGIAYGTKEALGALPAGSAALLIALGAVWLCMGLYVLREKLQKKK